jgi:Fe-S oxidoreductase
MANFLKKIKDSILGGNLMYFPGCLTHFVLPEIEANYKQILTKLNIDFITLDNFNCCGSPVFHAGYTNDFDNLLRKNIAFFKDHDVKRIVTNCPACFKFLKERYDMDIKHISQILYENLTKLNKIYNEEITYHDPCHLGRHSNVYEEPRKVLEKIGIKVKELNLCKERSFCCGGGGNLRTNNPEMSSKIARDILSKVKTKKLVSPCPLCYRQFLDNAEEFGIEVIEFSNLILPALK